jgi:peptidyl-prolyl cis-trans isomerase C
VYERNRMRFDHPDLMDVRHALGLVAAKDPPERREAVRRRMTDFAARAHGLDAEAFKALASRMSDAEVRIKVEDVVTALEGWTVRPFADAAFALGAPGDTSPPVETKFGWHVVRLTRRIPEEHRPLEAVREELRAALWPEVRRREFARFADGLVDRHHIEVRPGLLDETITTGGAAPSPPTALPAPAPVATPTPTPMPMENQR